MLEQLFNSNKDYSLKHYFPSIPLYIEGACKPYDVHACKYSTLQHAHSHVCSYHIQMPEITKWQNKIMLQWPSTVLRIYLAFWSVYTTVWSQKFSIMKSEYFNYCLCLKDAQWNQIAFDFLLCHSLPRMRKGRDKQPLQSPEAEGQAPDKHNWPVFLTSHLILYLC